MFDTPMFIFLLVGALGLYLQQRGDFGLAGKAGFYLTAFGFALGAVGGAVIVVVGLTVGGEATVGVLDMIAHLGWPSRPRRFRCGSVSPTWCRRRRPSYSR